MRPEPISKVQRQGKPIGQRAHSVAASPAQETSGQWRTAGSTTVLAECVGMIGSHSFRCPQTPSKLLRCVTRDLRFQYQRDRQPWDEEEPHDAEFQQSHPAVEIISNWWLQSNTKRYQRGFLRYSRAGVFVELQDTLYYLHHLAGRNSANDLTHP